MAKKTTSKKKTVEAAPKKPPIEPEHFNVTMSPEELLATIQILAFSKDVFDQMAKNLKKDGDSDGQKQYLAKANISMILCNKLKDIADIGEPISREIH